MATSAKIIVDDSRLSRLDRLLLPVERLFALLSGLAIFSLMFLAAYSVSGREFFEAPLPGYVDYIEMAMPFIAFLGISLMQRDGGHIRMDIVIGRFRGRLLWAAELLSVLLILALTLALIWGSWAHFDRSFDCARPLCSRDSSIDIGLPIWPSKLVVPIAFSVLAARLLLQVCAYARALWTGDPHPAAVPLIMSVEEQARTEAARLEGSD
ncbi:MAG: TRAP transporter small permease subunit [Shimia sp.]